MNTLKTHFCASSFCVFFDVALLYLFSWQAIQFWDVFTMQTFAFSIWCKVWWKPKPVFRRLQVWKIDFSLILNVTCYYIHSFPYRKKKVNLKKKKLHFSSHSILCLHKASINLVELLQMNFVIYHVATIQWLIIYQVYRKIKRNFCFFAL